MYFNDSLNNLNAAENSNYTAYYSEQMLLTSLIEVEADLNMRSEPIVEMDAPSYLYEHLDGSTAT